jgi:hypothetical protein
MHGLPPRVPAIEQALCQRINELRREVEGFDRNYLLNVGESQLCEHLVSKYALEAPTLRRDEIAVAGESEVDIDASRDPTRLVFDRSTPAYVKGAEITIAVPFDGSPSLFHYRPSTFKMSGTPSARVSEGELLLTYRVLDHNKERLRNDYEGDLRSIEEYLGWIRQDVDAYVRELRPNVENLVSERKKRLLANAGLAASLGIPIRRREDESLTYSPPEIRRKPRIERPAAPSGNFVPEPALAAEEYDYILEVIERSTGVMEKSPSAFATMGEEDIRSHLLVQLNGHYEVQGVAEAFNHTGKTDILLPYDGRNVFIAECKFWGGPKQFKETIDQLLGYTAWRDTKTAVIIFNRNKDHTGVLEKVVATVSTHPCFIRDVGQRSETQFRYIFRHPADANRELRIAVLVFHVPVM